MQKGRATRASMNMGSTTGFTGIVTNNAYNSRLQPILLSAGVSGQNPVFSLCFDFHLGSAITAPAPCSFSKSTLGDNGSVYQIVNNRNSTRNQSFNYDSLNRIANGQSNGTQWGEAFTIDAWGNLTAIGSYNGKPHESLSTTANGNNQLVGFGYDAAGNMTSNGSASYFYDAENRLIAAGGYSYIYDGDGQRVEKCTEGTIPGTCATGATGTLYWRGTSSDPLSETDLSGIAQNTYIFFNGQRIARRDSGGAIHYYFSDQLGSHAVVENATATTCEQDIDYFPYGGQQTDYCSGGGVAQNYKFSGKERASASESSLDYFGARHYASSLGRFMVPDPAGMSVADASNPQSWNLYAYVLNNPLSLIDPDGLDCAYLNDDGDGLDKGGLDHNSNPDECREHGGQWLNGTIEDGTVGANADTGQVWGTNSAGFTVTNDPAYSVTVNGDSPTADIHSISILECTSTFAWSFARQANIQGDTFAGQVGQNVLGNTFSGMYDFYRAATSPTGTIAAFRSLVVNGLRQGLPGGGPLSQGLSGMAQDKVLRLALQNLGKEKLGGATVKAAAGTVGDIKIGVDLLAFMYSGYQCVK